MAKRNGGIIGPSNVPTGQYGGTASGVWRLRDAFNYIKAGLWPVAGNYPVGNSLRFNSGSSDSLTRTPATTGTSRRIMTFSFWTKRSGFETTNAYRLFSTFYSGGNNQFWIRFADNSEGINRMSIVSYDSGFSINLITTQVFTDPSAWYHFVIAFDTTQGTSSNRVKVYVNGSQITSFATSTYPSQNYDIQWNVTQPNEIGANAVSGNEFYNGYFSEINFIDGQALTPSSFGQTDSATGIWTPLPYTGTYGTNGFYLKFANSAALGTDSSGNANTFTVNNLTSVDQSTDTPTNNFCTINPLFPQNDSLAFTNGNLQAVKPSGTGGAVYYGNFGVTAGKWYWEMKCNAVGGNDKWIGIGQMRTLANSNYPGDDPYSVAAGSGGEVRYNNVTVSTYTMASWTAGDIIMVALDMDNSRVYWGKNGTWQDSGDPVTGTNPYTNATIFDGNFIFPVGSLYQSGGDVAYNFGSPSFTIASGNADGAGYGNFEYAVPSGYYSLNTKNLATFG